MNFIAQNALNPFNPTDQYRLKFNTDNPIKTARAKITEKGTLHVLTNNEIVWKGIEGYSEKKIRRFYLKFPSNFHVTIEPGIPCKMTISRKNKKSLLSFDNAYTLSSELKNGLLLNTDIASIIFRMNSAFFLEIDCSQVDEILSLFPYAELEEQKQVSRKLIRVAIENPSMWGEDHIQLILKFLKYENQCFRSNKPPKHGSPLFRAEESDRFLNALLHKEFNESLPSAYIRTIIIFLEMLHASLSQMECYRNDFTKYYDALTKLLEAKKDDEATFFLAYAKQAFKDPHNPIEENILQRWLAYDNVQTVPYRESFSSQTSLFSQALREHIPWISGLQQVKQEVSLPEINNISAVDNFENTDFIKQATTLLKVRKNKVIFVKGNAERAESFLKQLTLHYLNNYTSTKHPVPLFISDVIDPEKCLIEEVLEKYGLYPLREELKKVPTIWIINGLPNLNFNPFRTNNFELWEHAQIVFSCLTENLEKGYQSCLDPFATIRSPINRDVYYRELEIKSIHK